MAFQPNGGAPRGRGSGRARGTGRGGTQRGAGGGGPPLAAQMRQLNRLNEPDEMTLFRRYRDLEVLQVRSTYGPMGLLERQLLLSPTTLHRVGQPADQPVWLGVLQVDTLRSQIELGRERERALARRADRLPQGRRNAPWEQLTPEERRVLLLSQKEFNSFRAQPTAPVRQTQANQAGTAGPSQPNNGAGQDVGDDADEEDDQAPPAQTSSGGGTSGQAGGGAPRSAPSQKASPQRR